MDLSKLFETQKLLDARIVDEHKLHGQDLLPMKILALQVELGELANEWRGFKFWSKDQAIRNHVALYATMNYEDIVWGNPLLEEYVDGLHFILSIGNELSLADVSIKNLEGEFKDTLECFKHCNNWVVNLDYTLHDTTVYIPTIEKVYKHLISVFLELGRLLGFTEEQIEQAYYAKNKINHERQTDGY